MQPRVTLLTLAVRDVAAARRFYEALGWRPFFTGDDIAFYDLDGLVLGLFHRDAFAKDSARPATQLGVGGVALAHNVRSRAEVDACIAEAVRAGARLLKAAHDTEWGGYSGYFADPDGHPWEVAWNPHWPLDADGRLRPPPAPIG